MVINAGIKSIIIKTVRNPKYCKRAYEPEPITPAPPVPELQVEMTLLKFLELFF